jgi:regulator of protease activity HflC (stomatin/prohibitin superfamily)
MLIVIFTGIKTLEHDDQIIQQTTGGERKVINGPGVKFISPFHTSEWRKAELLGPLQYSLVKSDLTGEPRVEAGPKLLFLEPYDKIVHTTAKIVLQKDEYVRLVDEQTGDVRILQGPQNVVPGPTESQPQGKAKAVALTRYESVRITDIASGALRTEIGGENGRLVYPGPFEYFEPKQQGIKLAKNEWIRIMDKATGRVRVERGESIVFLQPTEHVLGAKNNKAVEVNREQAVLVLSNETGQQRLVTEKGVFFPGPYEEILEVRKLILVEPHEAVIVRDDKGNFTFYIGSDGDGKGTAFFLPPYNKVITMEWSSGSTASEMRQVTKIDLRAQYMTFEYEVRTSDNVRLRLEGTVFWRVIDVPKMVHATRDPMGDVWHHTRSTLIQAVSQATLEKFMEGFNSIVMEAFQSEAKDGFYKDRGVAVQSMEVTRFDCMDKKTAEVLQQIIQETTNRINRLQEQESENDVAAAKLNADIKLEKQRTELIQSRSENARLEAEVQGQSAGLTEAMDAATFLGPTLSKVVPNLSDRLELYKLHQELESRNKDTKSLSSGNANLFLTPSDMKLKLQMGQNSQQ